MTKVEHFECPECDQQEYWAWCLERVLEADRA